MTLAPMLYVHQKIYWAINLIYIHSLWMSDNYVQGGGGGSRTTILITYRGQDHY